MPGAASHCRGTPGYRVLLPVVTNGPYLVAHGAAPSAHVDTFCRDHLPPAEQWPELRFDLPELQYPDRLNCAVELLDDVVDRTARDRPCLHRPAARRWTYGELLAAREPGRARARRGPRHRARQPGAAARPEQPVAGRLPGSACSRPARSWSPRCRCCAPASCRPSTRSPSSTRRCVDHRFLDDARAARRPTICRIGDGGWATTTWAARRSPRPSTPSTTASRRRRAARVHLRHHRPAQGDDALPPRRPRERRHLLAATCSGRRPTTSSPARRRYAFTFGLGGGPALPAARRRVDPADREGDARSSSPTSSTSTA